MRLTIVLAQSDALKIQVMRNPVKYGSIVGEVDRIYDHTRNTIYELNMEILKLRDTSDELLSNYKSSINELIEI